MVTNMKLLIFSDSHGTCRYMIQAIQQEKPNYVIHLGDHAADADDLRRAFPMLPIANVRGNCDFRDFDVPEQRIAVYEGVRILMAHGHRYGVKSGLLRYGLAAKENQVDVALFGHTHTAYCEQWNGIWLLNPGCCGYGRPTFGMVEIENGKASCAVRPIAERMDV